jgi:hypothetical protein
LTEYDELKKRLNIEINKNFELQRIENFLRGEVIFLRKKIDDLLVSSEYKIGKNIKRFLLINFINKVIKKLKSRKYKKNTAGAKEIGAIENVSSIRELGTEKQAVGTSFTEEDRLRLLDKRPDLSRESIDDLFQDPKKAIRKYQQSSQIYKTDLEIDTLIVQLSNNKEIGGIAQLDSIYKELRKSSPRVQSLYLNHDFSVSENSEEKFFASENLESYKVKKIIFSGLEAFSFIKKYNNLFAAKKINYLQGPDYLFPGNEHQFELFKESITSSTVVIAQSPYLADLAKYIGGNNIHTITLGPKETVFFDSKKNKEKVLLISTRKDPDKGLRYALPVLENIRNEGWKVIGFGDLADPTLAQYFDEHLGRIVQNKLAELFQSAALILDLSSYEGLGLTALEAGLCGVRPIVSRKGGIESLKDFEEELIFIESPLDLNEITRKISDIKIEDLEFGRDKLTKSARKYSWENSITKMISTINSI